MKLFTVNNLSNLLGVTRLGVAILLTFLRSASGDSSLPERSKWNCCPGTTFLFSQSLFHSSWIFLLLPDSFWLTMARDSSNMEQYICIMSKLIWIQVPFHRISNNVNKYTVHDIGNYFLNNNQDYQKGIFVCHLSDWGLVAFHSVLQNRPNKPAHISRTIFQQPTKLLPSVFPTLQYELSCSEKYKLY